MTEERGALALASWQGSAHTYSETITLLRANVSQLWSTEKPYHPEETAANGLRNQRAILKRRVCGNKKDGRREVVFVSCACAAHQCAPVCPCDSLRVNAPRRSWTLGVVRSAVPRSSNLWPVRSVTAAALRFQNTGGAAAAGTQEGGEGERERDGDGSTGPPAPLGLCVSTAWSLLAGRCGIFSCARSFILSNAMVCVQSLVPNSHTRTARTS